MGQQCSDLIRPRRPKHRCTAAQGSTARSSLEDKYVLGKTLAPKVVEVTHRVSQASYVAYRIKKSPVTCKDLSEPKTATAISRIQSIDHPNVCHLVEAFDDEKYISLVYSKVNGKQLFEQISKSGHSEAKTADIAYQILRAISIGLDAGVFHGALAPKNLFLDDEAGVRTFCGS
eukprot:gb/GFBE01003142.1/.p1 GENE.gb/GFBE01003142.1/~~gb/GFBE01003142.1/.p1  ORF type:complete len:174 (+),score=24.90 gb/GFBE01003142.1/:1-522(+)